MKWVASVGSDLMTEEHNANEFAETKKSTNPINRRKALKKLGAVGAGVSAGSSLLAVGTDTVRAYNKSNYADKVARKDSHIANYSYGDFLKSLSNSIIYRGTFKNMTGQWLHQFDQATHFLCRAKDPDEPFKKFSPSPVRYHRVTLENRSSYSSLFTTDDNNSVGVYPAPNGGQAVNFGNIAFTAIKGAVALIRPAISIGITAAEITNSLLNDGNSSTGDRVVYEWNYAGNEPSDVSNFLMFYFQSPRKRQQFYLNAEGGPGIRNVHWTITIGPNVGSSVKSQTLNTQQISNDEIPNGSVLSNFADGGDLQKVHLPMKANSADG